jgi:hypothetical protein
MKADIGDAKESRPIDGFYTSRPYRYGDYHALFKAALAP